MTRSINTTTSQVLDDALMALSSSSLLQIAKHCESSIELAKSFNENFSQSRAMIEDDRHDTLRQLALYCCKVIELQAKHSVSVAEQALEQVKTEKPYEEFFNQFEDGTEDKF